MGKRKASVFPEPVCDWMKMSLCEVEDRVELNTARCMDVGFAIFILVARWEANNGWRPKFTKDAASVSGALLGIEGVDLVFLLTGCSTAGLEVKRDEII